MSNQLSEAVSKARRMRKRPEWDEIMKAVVQGIKRFGEMLADDAEKTAVRQTNENATYQ